LSLHHTQLQPKQKLFPPAARPRQIKNPWSEDEQRLFIEGFKIHGVHGIKEIAEHIGGSRTIVQVRSHLQKHMIKERKTLGTYVPKGPLDGVKEAKPSGEVEAVVKPVEIKTTSLQLSKDGVSVVLSQRGLCVSRHSKKVQKSNKKSKE